MFYIALLLLPPFSVIDQIRTVIASPDSIRTNKQYYTIGETIYIQFTVSGTLTTSHFGGYYIIVYRNSQRSYENLVGALPAGTYNIQTKAIGPEGEVKIELHIYFWWRVGAKMKSDRKLLDAVTINVVKYEPRRPTFDEISVSIALNPRVLSFNIKETKAIATVTNNSPYMQRITLTFVTNDEIIESFKQPINFFINPYSSQQVPITLTAKQCQATSIQAVAQYGNKRVSATAFLDMREVILLEHLGAITRVSICPEYVDAARSSYYPGATGVVQAVLSSIVLNYVDIDIPSAKQLIDFLLDLYSKAEELKSLYDQLTNLDPNIVPSLVGLILDFLVNSVALHQQAKHKKHGEYMEYTARWIVPLLEEFLLKLARLSIDFGKEVLSTKKPFRFNALAFSSDQKISVNIKEIPHSILEYGNMVVVAFPFGNRILYEIKGLESGKFTATFIAVENEQVVEKQIEESNINAGETKVREITYDPSRRHLEIDKKEPIPLIVYIVIAALLVSIAVWKIRRSNKRTVETKSPVVGGTYPNFFKFF